VRHLIARRDPRRIATAYRSRHDGLPEPLCAIWEPAAREPLRAYATEAGAAGKKICPRKFLIGADVLQIDLPLAQALDNVNTREELGVARERLGAKTLRIQYYAILREQAGRSEETLDTRAATPAELYEELRQRHRFKLAANQLKVALNMEFSEWTAPLAHGDTVVFIPPVAGG
jgi:molybdopterin-guanine dinucleotide biosynthesis protein A